MNQSFFAALNSRMPQAAPSAPAVLKDANPSKAPVAQFRDILRGEVSRTPVKYNSAADNGSKPKAASETRDAGQKQQAVSFRDIDKAKTAAVDAGEEKQPVKEVKTADAESVEASSSEVKVNVKEGEKSQAETEKEEMEDAVVTGLAQVLGIGVNQLQKLLESMNITPEDLCDTSKTGEIVEKLSLLMDLKPSQSQVLTELIDTVRSVAETVVGKKDSGEVKAIIPQTAETTGTTATTENTVKAESADTSTWDKALNKLAAMNNGYIKLQNVNMTVVQEPQLSGDLQMALETLKAKLNEMSSRLAADPKAFAAQLSESLTQAMSEGVNNTSNVKTAAEQLVNESGAVGEAVSGDISTVKTVQPSEGTKQQNTGDAPEKNTDEPVEAAEAPQKEAVAVLTKPEAETAKVEKNTVEQESAQKTDDENGIKNIAVKDVRIDTTTTAAVQQQVSQNVTEVQKPDNTSQVTGQIREANVQKHEIISQVVEKAKVIVSGDKSEMVMDLKPDSLGKLALKVVTERGMVVAQFVAESQQVKEALQANMQLLKDSLEKQGLMVQGFSVTVQQESNRGNNGQQMSRESRPAPGSRINGIGSGAAGVAAGMSEKQVNRYIWGDSQINLTA